MNTATLRLGRLLEVRIAAGYRTIEDVDLLFDAIGAEIGKVPRTRRVVIVADWRFCPIMSAEAAERALSRISNNNPRVERSAVVASRQSPTAVLQFLRIVRESGHDHRKLFYEPSEVAPWLGEVLTPAERGRVVQFLQESFELHATG